MSSYNNPIPQTRQDIATLQGQPAPTGTATPVVAATPVATPNVSSNPTTSATTTMTSPNPFDYTTVLGGSADAGGNSWNTVIQDGGINSGLTYGENALIARKQGYSGPMGQGGYAQWLAADPGRATEQAKLVNEYKQSKSTDPNALYGLSGVQIPISQQLSAQVNNPQLAQGTQLVPELQQVQGNELMGQVPGIQVAPVSTTMAQTALQGPAAQGQAGQANIDDLTGRLQDPSLGQVTSTMTQNVGDMTAEQGTVSKESTVQGQLEGLYNSFNGEEPPAWARGAMKKAEDILAARGLGSSSIAGEAIASAIQEQAINIAATDAASYFQMDMKNLDNRQQSALESFKNKQQNMLTDTAIANATSQFNAASQVQVSQFVTSLVANIRDQNASRATTISQFNAAEQNKVAALNAQNATDVSKFNAQQDNAVKQFNSTMDFNRQQFNSSMGFAVDQSNALWRRSVNTSNNAAVNASNQVNAQNMFNMSATAQNNLWQQWRDEASFSFTAWQNDEERKYNAAQAANNRDFNSREDDNWLESFGAWADALLR